MDSARMLARPSLGPVFPPVCAAPGTDAPAEMAVDSDVDAEGETDTESFAQEMDRMDRAALQEGPHPAEVAPVGEDTAAGTPSSPAGEDVPYDDNASNVALHPSPSAAMAMDEDAHQQRTLMTRDGKHLWVVRESPPPPLFSPIR